jgi:hypothetical protein
MKTSHIRRIALAFAVALLSVAGTSKAQQSASSNPSNGQSASRENGQLQQVTPILTTHGVSRYSRLAMHCSSSVPKNKW